ncbi:MAG: NhaB family Na+:H+ antiporter [Salibacteraceae bacterium]|jgi:NhaB family Na+:H+ antiporter
MLNFFLGNSPKWFKITMISFLIINVICVYIFGPVVTAWLFIAEFIFTLAMALQCYPLQSGGLLAIQALLLGLTSPATAYFEVKQNLEVILLLVFMVAGIYFMKPLLMFIFSKVFTKIKSKLLLSVLFVSLSAILSAFLDALTVMAVLISISVGFYGVYHTIHSGLKDLNKNDILDTEELSGDTLIQFKSFLRSLIMHGAVGTALGGVCTIVGEPQNLLIGERMGWDFAEFFFRMAPITIPVFLCGLVTTVILELTGWFDFGAKMPPIAGKIINEYIDKEDANRKPKEKYALWVQGFAAVLLIISLALHIAPVGFIGLGLIIFQTAFMGVTSEHDLGPAFEESLPFTGLLVVFFVIVAMIHDQHLFTPIIDWALQQDLNDQPSLFYAANGFLSAISDNVFVATVYIGEIDKAYQSGIIDRAHFEKLAIAINTGTNLPSIATPNGQAAFLFLLTSSVAPLIGLSYGKMVKMAFPYTIVLGISGWIGVLYFL